MMNNNGGAPADGGGEVIDDVSTGLAPEAGGEPGDGGEGGGAPRQLTPEEYEERDRQKTAALRQERAQTRQFRQELAELKRAMENGPRGPQRGAEDFEDLDIPDPAQDPMAALQALRKLAGNFTKQQRETGQQSERQQAEARFINELQTFVTEAEQDFRADHPDYDEACKHLKGRLREEFEDQGYRGDGLNLQVNRELIKLAHNARRNGADPAEVYWRVAVRRGYTAKNGERQIETMKRGQEHATRVPRGGGRNTNFSRDTLLKSEGADFEKMWKVYEQQATGGRG